MREEVKRMLNWAVVHKEDIPVEGGITRVEDRLDTIYNRDGITIDVEYYYRYIQISGISEEEFETIKDFILALNGIKRER